MLQVTLWWRVSFFSFFSRQPWNLFIHFCLLLLLLGTNSRINIFCLAHMFDINIHAYAYAFAHAHIDIWIIHIASILPTVQTLALSWQYFLYGRCIIRAILLATKWLDLPWFLIESYKSDEWLDYDTTLLLLLLPQSLSPPIPMSIPTTSTSSLSLPSL